MTQDPSAGTGSTAWSGTPDTESQARPLSSVGEIFADISRDFSLLMRQEVALAKAELSESASKAGKGAGMLGGAGGAGYFALLFLSLAFMFLLDSFMPIGWAAFIVGAIYGIAGFVLYTQGRKQLKTVDPMPRRTVDTLKEDAQWLKNPTG